jgi:hypothetical protein
MILRTTTNHENNVEMEVCWSTAKWMKVELFWRELEPEYEYGLDVDRHNELLPRSQNGEHAKEFR